MDHAVFPEGSDLVSAAPVSPYAVETTYGHYDLSEIPREAYPCTEKSNRGKHSYTLSDGNGAVIEVLLAKQGFFIKKVKPGYEGPVGQLTWSKFGGAKDAWETAKQRSGYGQ